MAHHDDGLLRIGPPGGAQDRSGRRPGADLLDSTKFALERERRLLRAIGGRDQDACRVGQEAIEPLAHPLGLFSSLRSKSPPEIRFAGLGFGMAPQDEIHFFGSYSLSSGSRIATSSSCCAERACAR